MRELMPMMLQHMQSPEMQRLYTNPRAMEAMMQIQQGMQTLQQEAPGAMPGQVVKIKCYCCTKLTFTVNENSFLILKSIIFILLVFWMY